ncbi:hypothetical protein YC2023_057132 [Brassica napus]
MVYERDGALRETEQHDGPSAPAIYFLVAALETIQDIDLALIGVVDSDGFGFRGTPYLRWSSDFVSGKRTVCSASASPAKDSGRL